MERFQFDPANGLLDKGAYPTTPATEEAARRQIQEPMNQIRDYINNSIIPYLDNGTGETGPVDATTIGGKRIYIQKSTPSGAKEGDVWISW